MRFNVALFDTSNQAVQLPPTLTLTPRSWAAEAVGGETDARIEATGDTSALIALGDMLHYRVQITEEGGAILWRGRIAEVAIGVGGLEMRISTRGMANRVRVLYSQAAPGNTLISADTGWAEDSASIARYGRRELIHSAAATLTAEQATALRSRILTTYAVPQRSIQPATTRKPTATLACVGDWQMLNNIYFERSDGIEEYNPSGQTRKIPVGLGFSSAYLGFMNLDSGDTLHEANGYLRQFANYTEHKIVIAGTTSNNGVRTITGGDAREPVSYTATTLSFESADDLRDSAAGLWFCATDDLIYVSGASNPANRGARKVKTTGSYSIEVSPGWNGGFVNDTAGATVTILRGSAIKIAESFTNEAPNGTTGETVTAYGQRVYQTFSLGVSLAWTLAAIELKVRKVGNPSDSLQVVLCADSGGVPGSTLETITIPAAQLSDVSGWISVAFSNTVTLNPGTTYGILIQRTGSNHHADFYEMEIAAAGGYSRGALKLYDGTTYQPDDGDLIFRCLGAQDTAAQIRSVIQAAGIDLTAVVDDSSGLSTWQYQSGDETAAAIIENLLSQGTADGFRLIADKAPGSSIVRIRKRAPQEALLFYADGVLREAAPGMLPVNRWLNFDAALLSGSWLNVTPIYIERCEYQPGAGWRIEVEEQPKPGDFLGVRQG